MPTVGFSIAMSCGYLINVPQYLPFLGKYPKASGLLTMARSR